MSRFLLGSLDAVERDQVLDRLAAEPASFDEMAATENDLIIRWHHRQLPADERLRFDEVYLKSSVRHARVDDILALLREAEAWKQCDHGAWNRLVGEGGSVTTAARWLVKPFGAPPLVWMVVLLAAYVAGNRVRQASHLLFGSALVAVGEKGPWPAQGFDRLRIPRNTADIQLSFAIARPASGERFAAELQSVDGGAVTHPVPLVLQASPAGEMASVTIAAPPDGDYVLRLRRVAGGTAEIVVTKTFRVTRWPTAPR